MGRATVGDFMLLTVGVLKPLSGDQGPGEGHGRERRGHADTIIPGKESLWSVGGRERTGKP